MTEPTGNPDSPLVDPSVDPLPLDPTDEQADLAAETTRLNTEDAELADLDDTLDDDDPQTAVTVDEDVDADPENLGPAPVGTTLTPAESTEINRQIAEIEAANAALPPAQQISLDPEVVS